VDKSTHCVLNHHFNRVTSPVDTRYRSKFLGKTTFKHVWFDMTFLKIILPLGWLVEAWYCRSLCRCLGMLRRHVIWVVCSIDCWRWIKQLLEMDDGCTNGASTYTTIYQLHWHRVPTSYPSTVPAAHEPGTRSILQQRLLSSDHFRSRVVAPSLNISPRSPVSVLRSSSTVSAAVSSFVLPPSRWPTPAGRRGHVRTAVLSPRFAHATPVRYW